MQIHQFSMQYSPEEDRILFRMNTLDKEEFSFYLTRRFVGLLWPLLLQQMEKKLMEQQAVHTTAVKAMLDFEHEKIVSRANFQQKYDEDIKNHPLGNEPVLLTQIRIRQKEKGNILCLLPSQGRGVEFSLTPAFLHTFCKLLQDAVGKADWGIHTSLPGYTGSNPGRSGETIH
ncbi:MAG: hypothetical protein V2I97_03050 [Desulfococcaceae bacterium]|jgi:hypothetical protein|nr:hypothetical protein [Desulfococcaceae bacterium]